MKKFLVILFASCLSLAALAGCQNSGSNSSTSASAEATSSTTADASASIKDNPTEAEQQIQVAMQYLLEEAYGDKVTDARIYVEKIYTAEEEQADELLKSYNLGADEVAFEVRYELLPADGTDVNELMAATGVYDEDSGWVTEKYNVGILRPSGQAEPAYTITDFGTAF